MVASDTPEPEVTARRTELRAALMKLVADTSGRTALRKTQAGALLDALVAEVRTLTLADAVEAARGEYLHDDTGTPEDEAYQQGVADAIAAIGRLAEPDIHCGRQKPHAAHGGGDDSYRCPGTPALDYDDGLGPAWTVPPRQTGSAS